MQQWPKPGEPSGQRGDGNDASEFRRALLAAGVVLTALTVVKPLAAIAVVGPLAVTAVAALQLFWPLVRVDKLGVGLDYIGLHLRRWRQDLRFTAWLCVVFFPIYALLVHVWMTAAHTWAAAHGFDVIARSIPQAAFAPRPLTGWQDLGARMAWLGATTTTHVFGVALPEEAFYRGYLQGRLQAVWPARRRILGVGFGRAAVLASALFAAGHFLGEWNVARLGPFFPALIFAWQRSATGSIVGAIAFHAACNVLGETLFGLYRPW